MSGWGANVNGCLSYTACSYQPTEVMTLCIHAERRTSCDQLGYGVMNASRFDFILGRGGEARRWKPLRRDMMTLFLNSVEDALADWLQALVLFHLYGCKFIVSRLDC